MFESGADCAWCSAERGSKVEGEVVTAMIAPQGFEMYNSSESSQDLTLRQYYDQ